MVKAARKTERLSPPQENMLKVVCIEVEQRAHLGAVLDD